MSPEKIGPGLQNLMKQGLIECFNDPESRILYRKL